MYQPRKPQPVPKHEPKFNPVVVLEEEKKVYAKMVCLLSETENVLAVGEFTVPKDEPVFQANSEAIKGQFFKGKFERVWPKRSDIASLSHCQCQLIDDKKVNTWSIKYGWFIKTNYFTVGETIYSRDRESVNTVFPQGMSMFFNKQDAVNSL